MYYNLSKLEEKYEVKLDHTQTEVLNNLIEFINSDEHTICLSATAGCGKTILLSILYDILDSNGITCAFVAPTNKAKLVITKGNNKRASYTIHSLLDLRPNIDIMDFDASQLLFEIPKYNTKKLKFSVLLIDECSMINDDLYNTLCSRFKDTKLIFSGDQAQLAPVKQVNKSQAFSTRILSLTKIYRQKESKISKVLEYLRRKPLYYFKNVLDDNGSIIIYNNIIDMINTYGGLFKVSNNFKDYNLVKIITYTNNRITALNKVVRNKLYSDNDEYHIGEILTGYDSCAPINQKAIETSKDYVVKEFYSYHYIIEDIKLLVYDLILYNCKESVRILSRFNSQSDFNKLAQYLEHLRQIAVKSKLKSNWVKFFNVYNSFITPIDLVFNNRVIKRKSLDYGYCISAHKSQSSSYSIVMIDMENIWRCTNTEELRQLQYVACSRTMGDIIIYQKDR